MIRPLLRLTLPLIVLFIGALTMIHAQPAEGDVRTFLQPAEGCTMPCWLGIQPGVTTLDQALAILSAHPWLEQVQLIERPPYTYIYWEWSAHKPDFMGAPRVFLPSVMWAKGGIIQLIFIPTDLPYGEVSLLFGAPMRGSSIVNGYPNSVALANRPITRRVISYFDGQVSFAIQVRCPINLHQFWNAPVTITYSSPSLTTRTQPGTVNNNLARWLYARSCIL
jgi:hypothetical protein